MWSAAGSGQSTKGGPRYTRVVWQKPLTPLASDSFRQRHYFFSLFLRGLKWVVQWAVIGAGVRRFSPIQGRLGWGFFGVVFLENLGIYFRTGIFFRSTTFGVYFLFGFGNWDIEVFWGVFCGFDFSMVCANNFWDYLYFLKFFIFFNLLSKELTTLHYGISFFLCENLMSFMKNDVYLFIMIYIHCFF